VPQRILTSGQQAKLAWTASGLTQWQVTHLAGVALWAVFNYERMGKYVPPAGVGRICRTLSLETSQ